MSPTKTAWRVGSAGDAPLALMSRGELNQLSKAYRQQLEVAQALTDSLAHLRQQRLQISALAVLGIGALVVLGSRWLTAPLRHLTLAARRLQQGEYTVALPPDHGDEIGQLAGSLAALRDTIQERITQLSSARDAAEAANRAKRAPLANTSHALRTPLNGLLGMAQLARQPELDPARRQQYLDLVADSAQSLAGILSDTLDLARIEAGKRVLALQPFEPRALLQGVLARPCWWTGACG